MTRAAIYVRISDDREGKALGVQRQEEDCRALAERLGWTVVEVYSDNDVSAFSGKPRPAYRRMLADVRSGVVGAVLAYAPDRLYRRLGDLAEFIDVVTEHRCSVQTVAAGEVDLSTASGRTTAKLLGVIAEGESDRQGERVRRKLAERASAGLPHGGPRPFGWEPDRMTIRESEAEVIRWGVTQTLAGVPLRSQLRDLNKRGSTNSRGGQWTHGTYRGVITAARHAGLMRDGQTPASWPAIVSPEQHRAVVRLLSDPARVTTPGRGGRLHLLTGIAHCAEPGCGGPLRVGKTHGGRGGASYDVYRCYPAAHVVRSREHVDDLVRQVIARRLRKPDAAKLFDHPETAEQRATRTAAEREAGRLRLLIDEAAAEHGRLGLPLSALAAYVAPLREQLTAAEKAAEAPRARSEAFGKVLRAGDRAAAFLALPVDEQRVIIDALITIRIGKGVRGPGFRPDGIEIDWR